MRRVALCLGIDRYDDEAINNLSCAAHDAAEMAFTLRECGFDQTLTLTQGLSADTAMSHLEILGRGLSPGDLLVFFFAGHGKTVPNEAGEKDQLLLLPGVKAMLLSQNLLVGSSGLLSWRALKAVTGAWQGVRTLFILDACRLPLAGDALAKRGTAVAARFEGGSVFRDQPIRLAKGRRELTDDSYTVINSCDDGQQAEELPRYPNGGHGVLTAALIEELRASASAGQQLLTDLDFAGRLRTRMQGLVTRYGSGISAQQPMLVGAPVVLVPPRSVDFGFEIDNRLWRLAQIKAKTEGIAAYEEYLRGAPTSAAHVEDALNLIDSWHEVQNAVNAAPPGVRRATQQPALRISREAIAREALAKQHANPETNEALATELARGSAEAEREPCLSPGRVFRDSDWSPEMVVIPAGKFVMGSPDRELGRYPKEGPQREVQIRRPFAMGRMVVTFDEYDRYAKEAKVSQPGDGGWGRAKRPVIFVNWIDAQGYIGWLNGKLGLNADRAYRLPSEAEWEYVARAGTETPFWWGKTIGPTQANYRGNEQYEGGGGRGEYRNKTVEVAAFDSNPWGICNVHGNVWEWVEDFFHKDYKGAPKTEETWDEGGDEQFRVIRGGAWDSYPGQLRSAARSGMLPTSRQNTIGFRIAKPL